MKNPLWKRLPRELKSDFGKYIVIFLFMTLTIGFVSGFLVADDSMLAAYDEGFEKYNIEHGNFTLSSKASESDLKKIEKNGKVRICENFYRDEATDADLDGNEEETMRIYQERTDMNLVCLMSGGMPAAKNEIAIDRMYADNNKLKVGDKLKIGYCISSLSIISWFSHNSNVLFLNSILNLPIEIISPSLSILSDIFLLFKKVPFKLCKSLIVLPISSVITMACLLLTLRSDK